jgi:hypothetical protein
VALGDTPATKQPRVAGVAGFGVDLHETNVRRRGSAALYDGSLRSL